MEVLLEPLDCSVLRPLQSLFLCGIVLITSGGKSVHQARVVLVIILYAESGDSLVRKLLHLWRELLVCLGSLNLDGHSNSLDFLLCQKRRVGGGDAIDEILALCTELEDSPPPVAETDGSNLFETELTLEGLGSGFHFREADFLAVAADESHEVE